MMFRRGKGYLQLWERQKFPSKAWLRRAVKGHGKAWALDTFGHMSFGAVMGTVVAAISMVFFGVTVSQFAGITGVSWVMDLTINGRAETVWVNSLHRKWGRASPI